MCHQLIVVCVILPVIQFHLAWSIMQATAATAINTPLFNTTRPNMFFSSFFKTKYGMLSYQTNNACNSLKKRHIQLSNTLLPLLEIDGFTGDVSHRVVGSNLRRGVLGCWCCSKLRRWNKLSLLSYTVFVPFFVVYH